MLKYWKVFPVMILLSFFYACSSSPSTDDVKTGSYKVGADLKLKLKSLISKALTPLTQNEFVSISKAVMTIVDSDGNLVTDSDVIDLFDFGGTYLSESISIPVGTYQLTRYFVADSYNRVLFATPLEDSLLKTNVSVVLPITFTVTEDSTPSIIPEIIPVYGYTAGDFGYASGIDFPELPVDTSIPFPAISWIYTYFSSGLDGIWFNNDDALAMYESQEYFSFERNKGNKLWDAGADNQMYTADDTLKGWWRDQERANFGSWQIGGGADGAWFTADDVIERWSKWEERSPTNTDFTNAGVDGIWFTDDDIISSYTVSTFDTEGNTLTQAFYDGKGVDDTWFTGDDTVGTNWSGSYYVNTYEGTGNRWWSWTKQVRYNGPGSNGIWFDSDDDVKEWVVHEFEDPRFPKFYTREIFYFDKGVDGIMFTADDLSYGYKKATHYK